jgi:hypothetical protein
MELDGIDGLSDVQGAVTVLLGNVDGGEYDFALAFINTPTILISDMVL